MMKHRPKLFPLFLFLSLGMAACYSDSEPNLQTESHPMAAASAEANAGAVTTQQKSEGDASKAGKKGITRKLIRTAELALQVKDYAKTRSLIDAQLRTLGGYVESAQIRHHDETVSHANLIIRVPSDHLDAFLRGSRGMGKVSTESLKARDVTDQHVDVTARLGNARKLEGRLLELASTRAQNVKGLLEVERELARIRETIERYEATLKNLDGQVSMSRIALSLTTRRVYRAVTKPSLGEQLHNTLGKSFAGMLKLGHSILLALVALLPWIPPVGLAYWLGRSVFRRWQRRPKATAA